MMQNTFSGAYRLIHQNFAHCIRQYKRQLVRLRISQADCQASLWVPVDRKHFLSDLCQTYSQVCTGCCFANAAFPVSDGDEVTALSNAGISETKKASSYLLLSACIRIVFNCSDLIRLCQTLQRKIRCLRVPIFRQNRKIIIPPLGILFIIGFRLGKFHQMPHTPADKIAIALHITIPTLICPNHL